MRHNISVEAMINYLKEWCTKPVDKQAPRQPDEDLEGAEFTSTVQHIHNVYNYLYQNCPQGSLKELFHHSPAVFVEFGRYGTHLHLRVISNWYQKQVTASFDPAPCRRDDNWCSGRFYHLKEVCWSDPTGMFQRYRQLTHAANGAVQEPKILAIFYSPLEGMRAFFLNVCIVYSCRHHKTIFYVKQRQI